MKKLTSLILTLVLAFSFFACTGLPVNSDKFKDDGKAALDSYLEQMNSEDYSEENWEAIQEIISGHKTQIDAATTDEQVTALVASAKQQANAVPKLIPFSLPQYKSDACDAIDALAATKDEGNYTTEKWEFLQQTVAYLKEQINQAQDKAGVDTILLVAQQSVNQVQSALMEMTQSILVVESKHGGFNKLSELVQRLDLKGFAVVAVDDAPDTVDELLEYGAVVLYNIANSDMPTDFDRLLYGYVNFYGGSVLTIGGNKLAQNIDGEVVSVPNAYDPNDMRGTLYQSMLPVQCIGYTPPMGVIVIIDRSGSMSQTDEHGVSYFQYAKAMTAACFDSLSARDYFGVMTLDSEYQTVLQLTSATKQSEILMAINNIGELGGGTVFPPAIERAAQSLREFGAVEMRHIILITDGDYPGAQREIIEQLVEDNYNEHGIMLSVVCMGMEKIPGYDESTPIAEIDPSSQIPYLKMLRLAILGHGKLYALTKTFELSIRDDLIASHFEYSSQPFIPTITSMFAGMDGKEMPMLGGFYGSTIKTGATVALVGPYGVPIYAYWQLGAGQVGSFMSDLDGIDGSWSQEFLASETGQQIVLRIISSLLPA